jgi:uncharacterized membrane protein
MDRHSAPSTHHIAGMNWRQWRGIVLWLAIAAWAAYFLHSVYTHYATITADSYGMFWTRREWLWAHIGGGSITVILGLMQFATRRPFDFARVHRWVGRVYLLGMTVALTGAIGLIATSPAPMSIRVAFSFTALAWTVTAFTAWRAIRSGQVVKHRRWMIRNGLVTLAPIAFRALLPGAIALSFAPSPDLIAILLWLSWIVPVCVGEVAFWWRDRSLASAKIASMSPAGSF